VRTFGHASSNITVDGDNGRYVLWNECASDICVDSVTDMATGVSAVLPAVPPGWVKHSSYVLSPDGKFVATIAVSQATEALLSKGSHISPPCCYFGTRAVPSELLVYSTATDQLVEARSFVAASDLTTAWSPDSSYLFVTRDLSDIDVVPMWSPAAPVEVLRLPPGGITIPAAERFLAVASRG
jgi:hypothetical protein